MFAVLKGRTNSALLTKAPTNTEGASTCPRVDDDKVVDEEPNAAVGPDEEREGLARRSEKLALPSRRDWTLAGWRCRAESPVKRYLITGEWMKHISHGGRLCRNLA